MAKFYRFKQERGRETEDRRAEKDLPATFDISVSLRL